MTELSGISFPENDDINRAKIVSFINAISLISVMIKTLNLMMTLVSLQKPISTELWKILNYLKSGEVAELPKKILCILFSTKSLMYNILTLSTLLGKIVKKWIISDD